MNAKISRQNFEEKYVISIISQSLPEKSYQNYIGKPSNSIMKISKYHLNQVIKVNLTSNKTITLRTL